MAVTTSEKVPDESLHGLGYEPDAAVAIIELRCPAAHNALDIPMKYSPPAAVRRAQRGDAVVMTR
jgi:enoyl-CoA hydratase/carnithine racemase